MKISKGAVIEDVGNSKNYKTGYWRSFRPNWGSKECTQCMKCWQFCPDNAIPAKNGKRIETNFNFCKGCGICAEVCPVKCIKMEKDKK